MNFVTKKNRGLLSQEQKDGMGSKSTPASQFNIELIYEQRQFTSVPGCVVYSQMELRVSCSNKC